MTDVPADNGGATYFARQAPIGGKACERQPSWEAIRDADDYECGLFVRPRRGRAVLWPNARMDDLAQQHPETEHMALPIHGCKECVKWAANVWIHLYDFKSAHVRGLGG